MKTIIKRIIFISVFLTPFILFARAFYPTIFSKSLFIESVALLVGALFVIGKCAGAIKEKIPKSIVLYTFGIYVLLLLASCLFGVTPLLSFWGSLDHGTGVIFMLSLVLLSIVVSAIFSEKKDWFQLFTAFTLSGVLFTLGSFVADMGVHFSSVLTLNTNNGFLIGNTSWTGIYLVFVFFIGIGLLFSGEHAGQKIVGALGACSAFLNPTLTGIVAHAPDVSFGLIGLARTSSYALIIGSILFILYFFFYKLRSEKARKIFIMSFLAIITAGIIYFCVVGVGPVRNLLIEKAGPNRLVFWDIAMKGFHEKPLLGWGGDSYQFVYAKYFDPIITTPGYIKEYWVDRAHNFYFDELVSGGVLGFIGLISLYGILLWGLIRKAIASRTKEGLLYIALFVGLIAFLIQGLMIFQTIIGWFIIAFLVAFVSRFCFKEWHTQSSSEVAIQKKKDKKRLTISTINQFVIGGTVVIFCVLFTYMIIKPYHIDKGLATFSTKKYSDRMEFYQVLDDAYIGNITDLGNAFNPYHIKLRKLLSGGLTAQQTEMMKQEIQRITLVIDTGLKKEQYMDVKSLMSEVGMHSLLIAISSGKEQQSYYYAGMRYVEKMNAVSMVNPINKISKELLDFSIAKGESSITILNPTTN